MNDFENLDSYPVIFVNVDYCRDILEVDANVSNKDLFLSEYMNNNSYSLDARIGNIAIYSSKQ